MLNCTTKRGAHPRDDFLIPGFKKDKPNEQQSCQILVLAKNIVAKRKNVLELHDDGSEDKK
jgi:hypothetical protein